jgi:hypothetical protein
LIRKKTDEFKGKTCPFKMNVQGQYRQVTIINYHGVIRAAMLAKTGTAGRYGTRGQHVWMFGTTANLTVVEGGRPFS